MSKPLDKLNRQQEILNMLNDPEGPYTMSEIIQQIDVDLSEKTFYRDIDQLRKRGAEIKCELNAGRHEYVLENDFQLDHTFSANDLLFLTILRNALSEYPGQFLEEKMNDLAERIGRETSEKASFTNQDIDRAVSFRSPAHQPVDPEIWKKILDATLKHSEVVVEKREGKEETLWPYHMTCLEGEWYLLAGTPQDPAPIQHSFSKILSAKPTPGKNHFEKPGNFDPNAMLEQSYGRLINTGETRLVEIEVTGFMVGFVRNRVFQPNQKVKELDGGKRLNIRFPASAGGPVPLGNVASWVLSMGPCVRVLEPPELVEKVKKEARQTLKLYE